MSESQIVSPLDAEGYEFQVGETVLVYFHNLIYEAKCLERRKVRGNCQFFVHYIGWSNSWDQWVNSDIVLCVNQINVEHMFSMYRDQGLDGSKLLTHQHSNILEILKKENKNHVHSTKSNLSQTNTDNRRPPIRLTNTQTNSLTNRVYPVVNLYPINLPPILADIFKSKTRKNVLQNDESPNKKSKTSANLSECTSSSIPTTCTTPEKTTGLPVIIDDASKSKPCTSELIKQIPENLSAGNTMTPSTSFDNEPSTSSISENKL